MALLWTFGLLTGTITLSGQEPEKAMNALSRVFPPVHRLNYSHDGKHVYQLLL